MIYNNLYIIKKIIFIVYKYYIFTKYKNLLSNSKTEKAEIFKIHKIKNTF